MKYFIILLVSLLFLSNEAFAMHIAEGFLPMGWALFWIAASLPFILWAFSSIRKRLIDMEIKMLFIFVSAFILLLSSLKLPSIAGSSSHPTGVGLGIILFGPFLMSGPVFIVLLLQVFFVAHGGLSTIGASVFSMGIIAPIISYFVYSLLERFKVTPFRFNVFVLSFLCGLLTYLSVSAQLAFAFPGSDASYLSSFLEFVSIFFVVQLPIAIVEGLLTVFVVDLLIKYRSSDIILIQSSFKDKSYSLLKNLIFIFLALALMFLPYFFFDSSDIFDLDELAASHIQSKYPSYNQWFDYLFEIPSSYESFIFLAMGVIAFAFIAYYLFRGSTKAPLKKG